jgi:IPT/TIG domain
MSLAKEAAKEAVKKEVLTGVFTGYVDPFYPVLKESSPLVVSDEQKLLMKEILSIVSSDHQFAAKGYDALIRILTGAPPVPVVTSLVPNTAEIGDASFTLHVHGTDFNEGSVIVFAGHDEPTHLVSSNEVTTGVDMSVWLGADAVPVLVKNAQGVASETLTFTFVVSESAPARLTEPKLDEPKVKKIEVKDK